MKTEYQGTYENFFSNIYIFLLEKNKNWNKSEPKRGNFTIITKDSFGQSQDIGIP